MQEIQKLNPPGLWQLRSLVALIASMLKLVEAGVGGRRSALANSRRLATLAREFRRKKAENLNMRIKAWVMQCPERIAWVRGIIGERAIKRWQKNRLADAAFTQVFGDGKSEFPNGLANKSIKTKQNPQSKAQRKTRTYKWKPFSLQKMGNVKGLLYGQNAAKTTMFGGFDAIVADFDTHWTVGIADTARLRNWPQPRPPRRFKPVEFTPEELVPEAATGIPESEIETNETANLTNKEPEIFPPPKAETSTNDAILEDVKTGFQHKPP